MGAGPLDPERPKVDFQLAVRCGSGSINTRSGGAVQPAFHALSGDPDSECPHAVCLPTHDRLRETCRTALETPMAQMIAFLREKLTWQERAQWLIVAKHCVSALTLLYEPGLIGQEWAD